MEGPTYSFVTDMKAYQITKIRATFFDDSGNPLQATIIMVAKATRNPVRILEKMPRPRSRHKGTASAAPVHESFVPWSVWPYHAAFDAQCFYQTYIRPSVNWAHGRH